MKRGRKPQPVNTTHDADITRLHAQGLGRNAISRELELPHMTVTRVAARLGLDFTNANALMPTEIRRREAAERRAALSLDLLDDVEQLRSQLFAPMTVYTPWNGRWASKEIPQPQPYDKAAIVRAMVGLLVQSVPLDAYDRAGVGIDEAVTFLDQMVVTIRGEVVPELEMGDDDRAEP